MTTSTISTRSPYEVNDNLATLERSLSGELITALSDSYDSARQIHSLTFDRYPAVIVRAANTQDVAEAVRFARAQELPLAVRSGGHSLAGHSMMNGSVVVDLSLLRRVTVDPSTRTAVVQAGANSADIAAAAQPHGLALSTGDTATVGIGGLTLGGGIGWMVRKHGLAIDNLLAATIVTGDGRAVRASAEEHPDLFWAIRGGGGNFGIVTEFEFRLAQVGTVVGGAIVLPATREVIRGYLDYTPTAPEELTTIALLTHAPPAPFVPEELVGQPVFLVGVCVAGDQQAAERALAPIRGLAPTLAEFVAPMPYPGMFQLTEMAAQRHGASLRSMFADDLSDELIDTIIEQAREATSPASQVQFRGLGGAFGRVASEDTAFAHRQRRLLVAVIAIWMDPDEDPAPHREWTQRLWETVRPAGEGVYVNFLESEGEARTREAYVPATLSRLEEVKRRYDPENMFRFNQNIQPAD